VWILQHKELSGLLALSIALFIPFYFILKAEWLKISSSRAVVVFFLVWVGLYTAEYFIFGPNSFIAMDSDSRNISFLYYLARIHQGGQFAHEIAGGQDLSVILPGTQYLVPEKLLLHFLDPWIVVWLHKMMIGTLAFSGSYLLARGISDNVDRFAAVGAASVFPVWHDYLGNYSLEFGTGFAAVPLAVYASVVCVNRKNFFTWVLVAGGLLALAQPMKVFPAALLATACALLLYDKRNIGKTTAAFSFFILLSVVNWHEVLYGMLLLVDQTTRGYGSEQDVVDLTQVVWKFYGRSFQNWFVVGLLILSTGMLLFRGEWLGKAAAGSIILFSTGFFAAELFPWQAFGLSFINRIEHAYMFLALPVLTVPIAAKAFSAPQGEQSLGAGRAKNRSMAVALLSASFCLLLWNKFLNGAWFVALGGQSSSFGFVELQNQDWKTERYGRVVTLFDVPPPNITATCYGIDSFDGTILLNPKPWNDYWASIKKLPLPTRRVATRPSVDWRYWNGRTYAAGENFQLDLLRIANVKYLISALPLTGDGLKLLRSVDRSAWPKTRPSFFPGYASYFKTRLQRIFDPGGQYIYALSGALPRVFAATGVEVVENDISTGALHARVSKAAPAGRAVVRAGNADKLRNLSRLEVLSYDKVVDGYDVTVSAPKGGILMVNNVYLPYWRALVGGKALSVVPANGIHMAVTLPPGTKCVRFRYQRPLLREILFGSGLGGAHVDVAALDELRGDFAGKSAPRSTVKWVSKTVKDRKTHRKNRRREP